jgi:hypothetical protein
VRLSNHLLRSGFGIQKPVSVARCTPSHSRNSSEFKGASSQRGESVCRPKLRMCYREVATRPAERRTTTVAPSTCRQVSVVGAAAGTTVLACPDLMKRSTAARVRRAALPSLLLHAAASCCYMLLHLVAISCCILLLYAAASCCSTLLHLVAPCCCILLLTTVTGVRAEGGGEGGGGDAGRAEKGEGLDEAVEGTQHGLPSAAHVV